MKGEAEATKASVIWDINSCILPQGMPGYVFALRVKEYFRKQNVIVCSFTAMGTLNVLSESIQEQLLQSGVTLQGLKDGQPPHSILVLTGHPSLRAFNFLDSVRYNVTFVHPGPTVTDAVRCAVRETCTWTSFLESVAADVKPLEARVAGIEGKQLELLEQPQDLPVDQVAVRELERESCVKPVDVVKRGQEVGDVKPSLPVVQAHRTSSSSSSSSCGSIGTSVGSSAGGATVDMQKRLKWIVPFFLRLQPDGAYVEKQMLVRKLHAQVKSHGFTSGIECYNAAKACQMIIEGPSGLFASLAAELRGSQPADYLNRAAAPSPKSEQREMQLCALLQGKGTLEDPSVSDKEASSDATPSIGNVSTANETLDTSSKTEAATGIVVSNLHPMAAVEDVEVAFGDIGETLRVSMKLEPATNTNTATIIFRDAESVSQAIESFDEADADGYIIKVVKLANAA
ncbi:hypothetical protein HDU77_004950 [Chytriomyces hyalinus]|nr:hypothetical protein HDU77_004950 [Chytriomyces hyalinus]